MSAESPDPEVTRRLVIAARDALTAYMYRVRHDSPDSYSNKLLLRDAISKVGDLAMHAGETDFLNTVATNRSTGISSG